MLFLVHLIATLLLQIVGIQAHQVEVFPKETPKYVDQTLTLLCMHNYPGKVSITWFRNEKNIKTSYWFSYRKMKSNQLTMPSRYTGRYSCVVNNETSSSNSLLVVLRPGLPSSCPICLPKSMQPKGQCIAYFEISSNREIEHSAYCQSMYDCKLGLIPLGECSPCRLHDDAKFRNCRPRSTCVALDTSVYQCVCKQDGYYGEACDINGDKEEYKLPLQMWTTSRSFEKSIQDLKKSFSGYLKSNCGEMTCRSYYLQGNNSLSAPWSWLSSSSIHIINVNIVPCHSKVYKFNLQVVVNRKGNLRIFKRNDINLMFHWFKSSQFHVPTGYRLHYGLNIPGVATQINFCDLIPTPVAVTMSKTATLVPFTTVKHGSTNSKGQEKITIQIATGCVAAVVLLVAAFALIYKRSRRRENDTASPGGTDMFTNRHVFAGQEGIIAYITNFKGMTEFMQPPTYSESDQNAHMSPPKYDEVSPPQNNIEEVVPNDHENDESVHPRHENGAAVPPQHGNEGAVPLQHEIEA